MVNHGTLVKIMARTWQDLGKASKELAMDLGKDTMASNTGVSMDAFLCDYFLSKFAEVEEIKVSSKFNSVFSTFT